MSEKQCADCIHFMQHYVKSSKRFWKVCCGHCINKLPSGHFRKVNKVCECFEQIDRKAEQQEKIKSATEQLEFIAQMLSELRDCLS